MCSQRRLGGSHLSSLFKVLAADRCVLLLGERAQLLVELAGLLRQLGVLQPDPGAGLVNQVNGLQNKGQAVRSKQGLKLQKSTTCRQLFQGISVRVCKRCRVCSRLDMDIKIPPSCCAD